MSLIYYPSIRAVFGLSLALTIFTFFLWPAASMESHGSNSSPIDGLRVTIEQTKTSPLTITSTVVNGNTYPVTFLLYNSPLDTIAPTIGLLTITPEGALQPLELPEIQIRREWPPNPDSLVQLGPGASQTAEIILKDFITSQLDKKASVVLKGHWDMVWTKQKDDITVDMLEQAQARPNPNMYTGSFATESLEITTV
ncbi:hypothetical protein THAR02_07570 [Trichoderma harzianum]|uniref:Uncharacterized protein n=1 Tax=Trichoderma harzianum TaxID=5544 RepID=A0A0F9X700_TRIHA|nr:hypothetical protein THAR02_07570 [Trichoderma harzianum]